MPLSPDHPAAVSRRAALLGGGAGLGALAAGALARPSEAQASTHGFYILVSASGDGDYTDLEAAVAAAPAGSTIFVKRGTYEVKSGNMRPAAGVRIYGEGHGSHIRSADGMNRNLFLVQANNVVIESVRLDGNKAGQTSIAGNCVYLDGIQGARILNCYVHDSPNYNIVMFPNTSRCTVQGNHVWGATQEGIELMGGAHCSVVGNVVWDCGGQGIFLWNHVGGDCRYNTVSGNTVQGCTFGIQVTDGAHDNVVTGNTSFGNKAHGIVVNECGANVVTGNIVKGNPSNGIHVQRAPNSVVADNLVAGNGAVGILVNNAAGVAVTGNNVTDNGRHGIDIGATYDKPGPFGGTCTGNVCAGNGTDTSQSKRSGISLGGAYRGAVVANNRCYDPKPTPTQLYGISVPDGYGSDFLIGPNILDGNATSGLSVNTGANGTYAVPYRKLTVTVGGGQGASVPHGLPYTPRVVTVSMTSSGQIWRSAAPDATNVYLTADGPSRKADVFVG